MSSNFKMNIPLQRRKYFQVREKIDSWDRGQGKKKGRLSLGQCTTSSPKLRHFSLYNGIQPLQNWFLTCGRQVSELIARKITFALGKVAQLVLHMWAGLFQSCWLYKLPSWASLVRLCHRLSRFPVTPTSTLENPGLILSLSLMLSHSWGACLPPAWTGFQSW